MRDALLIRFGLGFRSVDLQVEQGSERGRIGWAVDGIANLRDRCVEQGIDQLLGEDGDHLSTMIVEVRQTPERSLDLSSAEHASGICTFRVAPTDR